MEWWSGARCPVAIPSLRRVKWLIWSKPPIYFIFHRNAPSPHDRVDKHHIHASAVGQIPPSTLPACPLAGTLLEGGLLRHATIPDMPVPAFSLASNVSHGCPRGMPPLQGWQVHVASVIAPLLCGWHSPLQIYISLCHVPDEQSFRVPF